ncbi:MAG: penicillin-binding transpeptidase domain-containing protein [Solirubrobacteraceae bacterium]
MPARPAPSDARRRRLERRTLPILGIAALALVIGLVVGAGHVSAEQRAAERFATAWGKADYAGMQAALSPAARQATSADALVQAYRATASTATVRSYDVGRPKADGDDYVLPVTAHTTAFGDVRGTVRLPMEGDGDEAGVAWAPHLTFPGVPVGATLERTTSLPPRAALLARDNVALAEGPDRTSTEYATIAESIVGGMGPIPAELADEYREAGYPDDAQVGISGLERIFERRLAGTPGGELRAGSTVLVRREPRQGADVRTTLAPSVQQAAIDALAGRLGGVVAMKPKTGEILGVAGIAFSGLQPPGSTFKMITLAGALQNGIASPRSTYPLASSATLSGVELNNANGEVCGGTLTQAFAISCNSVFAPLGAELGGNRLVSIAERFGFNKPSPIDGAATSTIPPAEELTDDLALGSTAIGQGKVLATTLQMTDVAAAFALGGRLPKPTLAYRDDPQPDLGAEATSAKVARQVRDMMVEVVRNGTGTAAAISGVTVAGKTGTAELRSTHPCTPQPDNPESCADSTVQPDDTTDTTAWFAAFAPAEDAKVAVGVMLVANGAGGDTAAPAARIVLEAALSR